MGNGTKSIAAATMAGVLTISLYAADDTRRTWTFDDEATGQIAKGFSNEVGQWSVVASDKGKALAQSAKDHQSTKHNQYVIHSWIDDKRHDRDGSKARTYGAIYGTRLVILAQEESRVTTALGSIVLAALRNVSRTP